MLQSISERFKNFALECKDGSPLYHNLSLRIANDDSILELAQSSSAGQPEPNLLFGAVHYLLLGGLADPLRRYYPSMVVEAEEPEYAFPAFRKFAITHYDAIAPILKGRFVQTNEVQRSAYLYPSFLTTSQFFPGRPASMIELGASAGFNLLCDLYRYQFGEEEEPHGLLSSSLTLSSQWRGDRRPDFSLSMPTISSRVGVDLNPIDLMDQDQVLWLQALVWPENFERRNRLSKAIRIAMINPVEIIRSDAIEALPGLLDGIPESDVAYVYHTWFANQLDPDSLVRLLAIIDGYGANRDLVHIHNNIEPHLHATIYRSGKRIELPLANTDGHANWIEWLN